jgi:hypothetical protein
LIGMKICAPATWQQSAATIMTLKAKKRRLARITAEVIEMFNSILLSSFPLSGGLTRVNWFERATRQRRRPISSLKVQLYLSPRKHKHARINSVDAWQFWKDVITNNASRTRKRAAREAMRVSSKGPVAHLSFTEGHEGH